MLAALLVVLPIFGCSKRTDELTGSAQAIPAEHVDRVVALFNKGVAEMDRYQPTSAVKTFDEVVRLAPNWLTGRLNLGIALLNAQEDSAYPRAEAELGRVARAAPNEPAAHYALGLLFLHLGRADEARQRLERVLELDAGDPHASYQLAVAIAADDPTRATALLEQTLAKIPHHESACYRLQALLRQAGERERADEYLARFQALRAADAGVTSGFKYGEMGPYAETVRTFAMRADGTAPAALPAFVDTAAQAGLTLANRGAVGWPGGDAAAIRARGAAAFAPGIAVADVDGDADLDVVLTGTEGGLLRNTDGRFAPASATGLDLADAIGAFFGDYDRDGDPDLFVTRAGPNRLYRNDGGTFVDVTEPTGTGGPATLSVGAAWIDADHDGDLDVYVADYCAWPLAPGADLGAPNQLLRNNGDGTFVEVAAASGVDGGAVPTLGIAVFDADGDRDFDLYLLNDGAANALFRNDRLGRYSPGGERFAPLYDAGPATGVAMADLDQDGWEDLLLLRGPQPPLLLRQKAAGVYVEDDALASVVADLGGAVGGTFADLDLDGDLDLALTGRGQHVVNNQGGDRFRATTLLADAGTIDRGVIAADFDGDGMLELLVARAGKTPSLWRAPRPADRHWLTVVPVMKGAAARVEPTAAGLKVEAKVGAALRLRSLATSSGYLSSPPLRAHFGLGSATQADYVRLVWSDAVLQSELEVPGDQVWKIDKIIRRPSSCPVLFSWDGERHAFVTDFLGVGGVGFFYPPANYAPPDPTEAVRIPPEQIALRDGHYSLRIAEPLEEVCYFDHLSLRVYDHPADVELYPDERLGGGAPAPTGEPFAVGRHILARAARTDREASVVDRLAAIDRRYVEPPLDHRFHGFAHDHWLELDFGEDLRELPDDRRLVLYLYGWVEYTYSHVNYAAAQAGLQLQPLSIEVPDEDGGWRTAIADAGYPAGLPRMMTLDVTDLPIRETGRIRLRTNMELFWDHVFVAPDVPAKTVCHTLEPARADLRAFGYPREYSPDGREPTIYDYDRIDHGVPFKTMAGDYTRFGDVRPLLRSVDDEFVVMGKGEELALEFDARALPDLPEGWARTVVLYADGYCKDMDLYTAFPDTVGPMPFHAMDNYPPNGEPRDADRLRAYRAKWNTRRVGRPQTR